MCVGGFDNLYLYIDLKLYNVFGYLNLYILCVFLFEIAYVCVYAVFPISICFEVIYVWLII